MAEAQCASLLSRLERRVNRVPASKRNANIDAFFNPYDIMEPEAKEAAQKTRRRSALYEALDDTTPNTEELPAPAPAKKAPTKKAATTSKAPTKPRHAPSKSVPTTSTRAKKRSSDEANTAPSDDKENVSGGLGANKKRVRAATTTSKKVVATKPVAPANVLSPKNENVKAPSSRAKAASSNTKPR
jgi:hypothetical protein